MPHKDPISFDAWLKKESSPKEDAIDFDSWMASTQPKDSPEDRWERVRHQIQKKLHRDVKRGARAAATGLVSLADIPNLASLGLHAAGLKKDPLFYKPIASRVQDEIDEATKGDLQPQTKGEDYADTAIEGLAPLALAPLTGGASLTSTALRHGAKHTPKILKKNLEKAARPGAQTYALTSSNVAGTLGSSAALKAYTDAHDDPSLIGAIAASQLGQGVGRGLRHLAHPKDAAALGLGTLTHFEPRRYAAQKDLDLPLSISTTSKSPVVQRVDKLLSKTPGSKSVMTAWAQKREKALAHGLGLPQEVDLGYVNKILR